MTEQQEIKTYVVADNIEVLASTVCDLGVWTTDSDEQGYLDTSGGNRHLAHGITADGVHLIWIETNADPDVLSDDGDLLDVVAGMGDAELSRRERIEQGIGRIREAVELLYRRYDDNEPAHEGIEWFGDLMDQAERMLADEECAQ